MARKSTISTTPADKTKPRHTGTLFIQGIPRSTQAAFKAACARKGRTMRDIIIVFMRKFSIRNGTACPPPDGDNTDEIL